MNRVFRLMAVAIGLAGVAVVVIAGTRTWAHVSIPALAGMEDMALSGRKASALGMPVALAAGAGVIVMATSGRVIRFLVSAGLIAGGVLIVMSSLDARANAARSAAKAVESTIGLFNQNSLIKLPPDLLSNATADLTIWPMVSVAGGVLIAVSGTIGLITGLSWPGPSDKYESAANRPAQPVGARHTAGARATTGTSAGAAPPAADDARTWDALSRGDDPT